MKKIFLSLSFIFAIAAHAATEDEVRVRYQSAWQDFRARVDDDRATACADQALQAAQAADTLPDDAAKKKYKFDALVLRSRCLYFSGMQINAGDDEDLREAKLALFTQGKEAADAAVLVNAERAEGHFYSAVNLGRWAETNGVANSLHVVDAYRTSLGNAERNAAVDDDGADVEGREYDAYGVNRGLARMQQVLPFFHPNRDLAQAERLLEEAYSQQRARHRHSMNALYYAQVLVEVNKKALAIQVLSSELALIDDQGDAYNPHRLPETRVESAEMSELLRRLRRQE